MYLKIEHQEQIAFMETNIAKKMQKEIQKIQATSWIDIYFKRIELDKWLRICPKDLSIYLVY